MPAGRYHRRQHQHPYNRTPKRTRQRRTIHVGPYRSGWPVGAVNRTHSPPRRGCLEAVVEAEGGNPLVASWPLRSSTSAGRMMERAAKDTQVKVGAIALLLLLLRPLSIRQRLQVLRQHRASPRTRGATAAAVVGDEAGANGGVGAGADRRNGRRDPRWWWCWSSWSQHRRSSSQSSRCTTLGRTSLPRAGFVGPVDWTRSSLTRRILRRGLILTAFLLHFQLRSWSTRDLRDKRVRWDCPSPNLR